MDDPEPRRRAVDVFAADRSCEPGTLDQLETLVSGWPQSEQRAQVLLWLDEARVQADWLAVGRAIRGGES